MRFSDEKLAEFHTEFKQHVSMYEERLKTDDARFEALLKSQEQNTESIKQLIEETRGIIELHRDLQGATRLGMSAQKFAIWLTKWGVVGIGLAAAFNWGFQHLEKLFK